MVRRDKWWTRELERQNRAHAEERAKWDKERGELIETICRLAEKPAYRNDSAQPDEAESDTYDAFNDPDGIGREQFIDEEG